MLPKRGWVMGSLLRAGVVLVAARLGAALVIMGGGSFQPAPLETAGVKPGPGWSGMWWVAGGGAMGEAAAPLSGVKK